MGTARLDRVGGEARRRNSRRKPSSTSTATAPGRAGSGMSGSHSLQASSTRSRATSRIPGGPGRACSRPGGRTRSNRPRPQEEADLRAKSRPADRGARVGLRLHRVHRLPGHRLARSRLRRRWRRRHLPLDLRFVLLVHALFRRGLHAQRGALTTIGTALMRLADADVLPFEFKGTATTLSQYVDEIEKMPVKGTEAGSGAAAQRDRETLVVGGRLRKGARTDAEDLSGRRVPAGGAQHGALPDRTRLPVRQGAATARVVQAPCVCARLLHRLRCQDAARDPRRHRTGPMDEARSFVPIVAAAITRLAGEVDKATGMVKQLGS